VNACEVCILCRWSCLSTVPIKHRKHNQKANKYHGQLNNCSPCLWTAAYHEKQVTICMMTVTTFTLLKRSLDCLWFINKQKLHIPFLGTTYTFGIHFQFIWEWVPHWHINIVRWHATAEFEWVLLPMLNMHWKINKMSYVYLSTEIRKCHCH
jgi:hypothetical protein